jgi:phage gp36-like protein
MVMDVFVRFRLVAIVQSEQQTQAWEMQVMVIQQVADILISLGFLDYKAAALLTEASTTIRHQNNAVFGFRHFNRTRLP